MQFMDMLEKLRFAVWGGWTTIKYSKDHLEYLDDVFPAVSIDNLVHMDMDIGPKDTRVDMYYTGGEHQEWRTSTDSPLTEMLFALMVYGLRETHKIRIWSNGEYIIVCAAIIVGQRRLDDA